MLTVKAKPALLAILTLLALQANFYVLRIRSFMSIVLVANEKGGVGKSTVAVNLAVLCVNAGMETLLVDTDRQESSSNWAAFRNEQEAELRPITAIKLTGKVGYELNKLRSKYDVVIVDAGGTDSVELRQSVAVCDTLIMPMQPSQFDVWTLYKMSNIINEIQEKLEKKVDARAFINRSSTNPAIKETADALTGLAEFGDVFSTMATVVYERIAFRKAARMGQGVIELPRVDQDIKANSEMAQLYREIFNVEWKPV